MRTNLKWKCDTIQGSPRAGRAGQGPERGTPAHILVFERNMGALAYEKTPHEERFFLCPIFSPVQPSLPQQAFHRRLP